MERNKKLEKREDFLIKALRSRAHVYSFLGKIDKIILNYNNADVTLIFTPFTDFLHLKL